MNIEELLSVGKSDYGIYLAAENSVISLAQISCLFFNIFPSGENIISSKCISNWVDIIRSIYYKEHVEVFPDEKPIWKEEYDKFKDTND